jgi:Ca2+-binding RTX toxin-like protein
MSLYTTSIDAIMEFGNAGVVSDGYLVNPIEFHTDIENIRGTSKKDFLVGNDLSNKLFGGGGIDFIIGGGGNDQLIGEGGDDQMQADAGNDKVVGGTGFDFFAMQNATQGMTVDLAAGTATGMGADTLSGVESMFGSRFADILKGNGVFNFMMGGSAGDIMYGRGGGDHMYGESGNDKLYGEGGYDYLRGDSGTDVCKVGAGGGNVTGCP